ncbi:AAA domain-containing protein [Actinomadura sp. NPDC047616]|uniref:DEAD/DEAH box helicase n=1 Tax=Actinomadura sp. NPDC047616 TaxID=3155914 RepID=UPI0033C54569
MSTRSGNPPSRPRGGGGTGRPGGQRGGQGGGQGGGRRGSRQQGRSAGSPGGRRGDEITDPLPGPSTFVWVTWNANPDSFQRPQGSLQEVQLAGLPSGQVVARTGGSHATVTPETDEDGERLRRAMASRSRVAVLSTVQIVESGGRRSLRLGLSLYVYEQAEPMAAQSIGVGDRVLATVGKMRSRLRDDPDRILRWLRDRLLLPPQPGSGPDAPDRMIVSVGLSDPGEPTGYRVHGRGVIADVRIEDGRLVMHRLRRTGGNDHRGPLRMTRCAVTFTDVSKAGELRAEMRQQLSRLAAGKGFLAMWHEYNRQETQFVRRQVRQVGFGRYTARESLGAGVYRFHLDLTAPQDGNELTLAEQARNRLDAHEDFELEAAAQLPAVLTGRQDDDDGWALIHDRLDKDTVTGTVVNADVATGTVDVRLVDLKTRRVAGVGADEQTAPPPQGFLYRSFRGDRRQMQRRKDAFDRILHDGTRIPNLLALFEGKTVSVQPPTRVEPVSDAVRECFVGGRPTPMQEEALRVALNTPDIALIQGPPGTGKTQVIKALQTRLAELGRGYAKLRGSILLTSFQHAAVDELVERSEVLGVPAAKVDRMGRGTTVRMDRWRLETIDELAAEVEGEGNALGRSLGLLRRVAARSAGYLLAPTAREGTVALLRDIEEETAGMLSTALADRLGRLRWTLESAPQPSVFAPDDRHELALRALRGVRTVPESFADDGPAAAAKALRRVRALADRSDDPAVRDAAAGDAEALDLLERAAEWDEDGDVPPFLPDLAAARDRLLERLQPAAGPPVQAAADPEVDRLLAEIVEELEDHVRDSGDGGPELAMLDYLEGLRGDPVAVEWTLRAYTASYATTCQQAASNAVRDVKQETDIDDVVFDTVIVDEAARANPLDLMIPLIHAGRRIILVGDHNQLPHMLEPEVEQHVEDIDPDARGRLRESLFQRLFEELGDGRAPVRRVVTLNTQFRMHRVLGEFVSRNFYGGTIDSPRPDAEFVHGLPGYDGLAAAWLEVPARLGKEMGRRSRRRPAEARVIAEQLARLLRAAPSLSFGVISFYSDQVSEIYRQLAAHGLVKPGDQGYEPAEELRYDQHGRRLDRLLVGSVDAFQGREFDVVFLSTTRSSPPGRVPAPGTPEHERWVRRRYGHLTLRNRLCVAMSRQKRLLITVGDPALFEGPEAPSQVEPLSEFLKLCRQGGEHGRFFAA